MYPSKPLPKITHFLLLIFTFIPNFFTAFIAAITSSDIKRFFAVDFPFAKDDHQYFNAKFYQSLDSCWLIRQEDFKVNIISDLIIKLFNEKNEYFIKKDNLKKISKENTWNYNNKRLMEIIHEN